MASRLWALVLRHAPIAAMLRELRNREIDHPLLPDMLDREVRAEFRRATSENRAADLARWGAESF